MNKFLNFYILVLVAVSVSCAAPVSNSVNTAGSPNIVNKTYVGKYRKYGQDNWIAAKFWMDGDKLMLQEGQGNSRDDALILAKPPREVKIVGKDVLLGPTSSVGWKYIIISNDKIAYETYIYGGSFWLRECDMDLVK